MALKNRRTQKNKTNRRKQQNKQRKSLRKKRQSRRRMRGGSRSHWNAAKERLKKAIESKNLDNLTYAIAEAEKVGLNDDLLLKAKGEKSRLLAAKKQLKANAPPPNYLGDRHKRITVNGVRIKDKDLHLLTPTLRAKAEKSKENSNQNILESWSL